MHHRTSAINLVWIMLDKIRPMKYWLVVMQMIVKVTSYSQPLCRPASPPVDWWPTKYSVPFWPSMFTTTTEWTRQSIWLTSQPLSRWPDPFSPPTSESHVVCLSSLINHNHWFAGNSWVRPLISSSTRQATFTSTTNALEPWLASNRSAEPDYRALTTKQEHHTICSGGHRHKTSRKRSFPYQIGPIPTWPTQSEH